MPVKIFLANIADATQDHQLRRLFERFGEVTECDIVANFGFVHMQNEHEAKAAIDDINGKVIDGKTLSVELSKKPHCRWRDRGGFDRGRGRGRGDWDGGRGGGRKMGFDRGHGRGFGGPGRGCGMPPGAGRGHYEEEYPPRRDTYGERDRYPPPSPRDRYDPYSRAAYDRAYDDYYRSHAYAEAYEHDRRPYDRYSPFPYDRRPRPPPEYYDRARSECPGLTSALLGEAINYISKFKLMDKFEEHLRKSCKDMSEKHECVLEAGMQGFLVTCNMENEGQAVNEAYNILNEYADMLYKPDLSEQGEVQSAVTESASCENTKNVNDDNVDDDSDEDDDDDMEAALKREVIKLKNPDSSSTDAPKRNFQNVTTNAKNLIFISTTLPNPVELVYKMFSDLAQNGVQKTHYAHRLLPIIATCKAYQDDIIKCAEPALEPLFKKPCTFCVEYKSRNNTSVGRNEIIRGINSVVKSFNCENEIEYNIPNLVVLIEVVAEVCCIGVARDFFALRKYNLIEVLKGVKIGESKKAAGQETKTCDVDIKNVVDDTVQEVSDIKHVEDGVNSENISQACNLIDVKDQESNKAVGEKLESCDVNMEVIDDTVKEVSDIKHIEDEVNSGNMKKASG